ncbi:short chain dehydrogenase [Pedobacter hiemivivus]|uniref:Short chain dehydrogenase n=1 Tax=Pedobacter hiemivivus TaxID=2530454 RepID=A0A4R0N4B4_9SPHI|nr:short chain dehydrogenase [Pedobacter hiemivivus]TCC94700.1 short chain dehydrogenase [Pedobacter hiemivivus]TKC62397.1 short chain dehydrogenase [Pedobacter hiemivivus]
MIKKIIVIGASGTIGKEVANRLEEVGHEVIRVSRNSGDYQADISDKQSLANLFKNIGSFDSIGITAGEVAAAPFENLTDENYSFSLGSKLMGQINVVRTALPYINVGGSFTLVSGVLTDEPILGGTIGTVINGGIEGFVKAASNELPKSVRINCISPTVLTESEDYHPFFPGFIPVEAWKVARAYERAISGVITGRIIKV